MARRVLLTGGNGFIGSHILAQLLDHGCTVCCAVRTQEKGDKILRDFAAQQSQITITIVPDIVAPGAYDTAVQGTPAFDAVYHTASPFTYANAGSNLQFLEPAIKGTLNLLKAVKDNAPSVKRVIWTGSCASVIDYDNLVADPPRIYREADWNPVTWEEAVNGDPSKAYRGSKLFAEREEAGNQRFVVCARQFDFQDVCDILRSHHPELSERTPLGKPGTSSLPPGAYSIDNSKVKKFLGVEFRSLEETVLDAARCMLDIERNEKQALST
ncbi:unnamed protein product [Aspergillus oryzae]|nr:unnamed protein product [Aspergillus oryzae]